MALPDEMLELVKNRLNITWSDRAIDSKMIGIIEDGIAYLDNKCGTGADYAQPSRHRQLLMEYCRYARDEALDVFESNYLAHLVAAKNERAVKDYEESALSGDE